VIRGLRGYEAVMGGYEIDGDARELDETQGTHCMDGGTVDGDRDLLSGMFGSMRKPDVISYW